MRILYIFPHPDDESFGPAPAIAAQLRQGFEVHLLTLTKGEATKQRFKLGLNKEQMGEVRFKEMKCVEKTLGLTGIKVTDLPDGELKNINPIDIEKVVANHIYEIKPAILITYAVHGISGFHDHLVTHAVVKRVFCELKDRKDAEFLKRLALYTRSGEVDNSGKFRLEASTDAEIKYTEHCSEADMEKFQRSLDCYETYKEIIEKSRVREIVTSEVPFEIFGEDIESPLTNIADQLKSW
ncbi:MAG: PIG-L family deacetylase [Balneolaceae bacterium]|nr:MAG: PIG-L family deacetylase [Balneolaceae bacterium]